MPRSESNDYEAAEGMDQLTPEEEDWLLDAIERRIEDYEQGKGPDYFANLRKLVTKMDALAGGYKPRGKR